MAVTKSVSQLRRNQNVQRHNITLEVAPLKAALPQYMTLRETARLLGCSDMQVLYIENGALLKIKRAMLQLV